MFKSPTVFVVGAGASADVGLPLGDSLRNNIVSELQKVESDGIRLTGPEPIIKAIRSRARADDERLALSKYFRALQQIAENLPLYRSIDEFVEHNSGNKHIEFVAKVAICWSILRAEAASYLLAGTKNRKTIDTAALRHNDAWLLELLHMLRSQGHVHSPQQMFENVAFIVFNYDRCLEAFLLKAVEALALTTDEEAERIVDKVRIIHPYGRVGGFEGLAGGIGFGAAADPPLERLAANIRTYGESERDALQMATIRSWLNTAQNIVFIGFAFHEQNMDFFERDVSLDGARVYATAYGVPDENWSDITAGICSRIHSKKAWPEVVLRRCQGAELLRIYNKPMTR